MAVQQREKWLYKEKMTHRSPIEWFHFVLQYTGFICNNKPFRSRKPKITYMKQQQEKYYLRACNNFVRGDMC